MRASIITVSASGLVMLGALIYGFGAGNGWAEVRELATYPWFVVSIIDVYVGFVLFACWIAMRERAFPAIAWIVALMALGNIVACAYAIIAMQRARSGAMPLFPNEPNAARDRRG